jgi:NADH-quinone oxidoreductase subunit A
MPAVLVGYLLLFVVVGVGFILVHLLVGKLVRPARPDAEKLTIYECGEPTVGSAWVQFDLRFYVVALLFVIFDVEVAFFFPWAVVFGKTNAVANPQTPEKQRIELVAELNREPTGQAATVNEATQDAANRFGWIAFFDILVFFGVLLVGFAYLWSRGDLEWVRSTAAERQSTLIKELPPAAATTEVLVPAGTAGVSH